MPFLGVDIGGTFTDFVLLSDDGQLHLHKRLTTPADPAQSVLDGIAELGLPLGATVIHGTTIATNALLERRGATTALITTAGFEDVLAIGRQTRPDIYAAVPQRPAPLVPAERRLGLHQRITAQGDTLTPLNPAELTALIPHLRNLGVESVAVSLLFGFLQPATEQAIAAALAPHFAFITLASDLLPEYREYERTSTVVINAYVAPLIARYLDRLAAGLHGRPLRVMQSNGGIITPHLAAQQAARTALSGPAGGAVGAMHLARLAGYPNVITFDMGGTSTDVALCPGQLPLTSAGDIADLPLRLPIIDIHTVGAGGGSLALIDAGGALRVGPESAGADPGPVCYGRGGLTPTVTDANLLLGRLPAQQPLAGSLRLDLPAARAALESLARSARLPTAEAAALGVLQIANAAMERAIRHISVERGHDPRHFTLLPFGGAGPLHAADLATRLGIGRIFIPPMPGVLSALGMLIADITLDASQTVLRPTADLTPADLDPAFTTVEQRLHATARDQGLAFPDLLPATADHPQHFVDVRYIGQSFEITVPWSPDMPTTLAAFHQAHQQRYGHSHPEEPTEIVTLRVRHTYRTPPVTIAPIPTGDSALPATARLGTHPVWFDDDYLPTPLIDRAALLAGNTFSGPAIILQPDSTTVVPPGWSATVDSLGNLILTAN